MLNLTVEKHLLLSDAILRTVAYEDVFDYPLTVAEIHRFLPAIQIDYQSLAEALKQEARLSLVNGYYTLPGREGLAALRQRREHDAARWWREAQRYGRLVAALPFVRMLAVTGSLAMNNPGQDADIDYLLVTAPGRLWTCRALVLGVARLAALRGVRLCPNYLVSEQALVFSDQNLYTAHELVQMVPLYGMGLYAEIRRLNSWAGRFLPNASGLPPQAGWITPLRAGRRFQALLEAGFRSSAASRFERWEMERKILKLSDHQEE